MASCDKNHNPRKGTERFHFARDPLLQFDKNHNPRKGTESLASQIITNWNDNDKNHNPRKGTESQSGFLYSH